jgi:hypothetical protein
MCDKNIGNLHVGHGRLPTGGVVWSEMRERCMVLHFNIRAGAQLVSRPPPLDAGRGR